jgi:Ca2+-transporting ATPase
MVIDPACSVVFESEGEEKDVMRRPPRKPSDPVLPRAFAAWAAVQGLAALTIVSLALYLGSRFGMPEGDLRAFVFTTLVVMNVGLILVNRSFRSSLSEALLRKNVTLWILVAVVLLVLSVVLYWGPAQALLGFGPLHVDDLSVCIGAGAVFIGLLEIAKRGMLTLRNER